MSIWQEALWMDLEGFQISMTFFYLKTSPRPGERLNPPKTKFATCVPGPNNAGETLVPRATHAHTYHNNGPVESRDPLVTG